jgi:hypothetical protein
LKQTTLGASPNNGVDLAGHLAAEEMIGSRRNKLFIKQQLKNYSGPVFAIYFKAANEV